MYRSGYIDDLLKPVCSIYTLPHIRFKTRKADPAPQIPYPYYLFGLFMFKKMSDFCFKIYL
ncbi:hypothetical protein J41TS2_35400 [Bacillus sonorensis]|nr:hypothetical protein J41TS2_35400 [Bacillus sonorensis]